MLNFLAAIGNSGVTGGAGSFESIATATGTGSSSTITFSSIPSGFQHLQIRMSARHGGAGGGNITYMRFNNDTNGNYTRHRLSGVGSMVFAEGWADWTGIDCQFTPGSSALSTTNGVSIIDIHDYKSTTKNKTVRCFYGLDLNTATTDAQATLTSGVWRSTSAIDSIQIVASGNFTTSSTFALYGIKGA